MKYWDIRHKGFLPALDPPDLTYANVSASNVEQQKIIDLARLMPHLAKMRSVREELVSRLRGIDQTHLYQWIDFQFTNGGLTGESNIERIWRDYSYFASMYIWAPDETPQKRIPREIAVPFNYLATRLDRKPILSYMAYCLSNWRQTRPVRRTMTSGVAQTEEDYIEAYVDGIRLGNLELIQNFTVEDSRRDENWFILVHVDIEARAAKGIRAIIDSETALKQGNQESVRKHLEDLRDSIQEMNATLDRMPEECSSEVYFDKVRPYIYSFEDTVYEGVHPEPVTYRGETGAQSPVVPAIQIALGVMHEDSILTKHLKDMRDYMPKEHRQFLTYLEERPEHVSFRHFVTDHLTVRDVYNECVQELFRFRTTHLKYAVEYIQNKCDDPKGTGGTLYMPWLTQLTEETEAYLL